MKCCVLYNPDDGAILHTHRVVDMFGTPETEDRVVEDRTRQLARGLGLDVARLELLHVDPKDIQESVTYRVDKNTRRLVATKDQPADRIPRS